MSEITKFSDVPVGALALYESVVPTWRKSPFLIRKIKETPSKKASFIQEYEDHEGGEAWQPPVWTVNEKMDENLLLIEIIE